MQQRILWVGFRKNYQQRILSLILLLILGPVGSISGAYSQGKEPLPDMSAFVGNKEGLTELIELFSSMNYKTRLKFSKQLRPDKSDYYEVFINQDFAEKIYLYHKKLYHGSSIVIQPNLEGQSEILLWEASQDDFKKYIHEAVYFPGGYKEIADEFNPDLKYYRFKYVQPGKHTGSAYDMFVYVSGKWRFFPRPWAVAVK
ncbi:MAG: hypothetical protein K1X92_01570 [Bacteroidia bacterium]|nr:hypothetical protein [Bacteroidia bacterium]